jgi:GntR family transcriptional regulator
VLLTIEPDGPVPIYQQIRDQIVEAIADGRQSAGSALPSTRQLAVDLGVNFHTVNKSYDLLRREGLLRISRKSGAVVQRDAGSGPPDLVWAADWAGRLRTLLAEAVAHGLSEEDIVLYCRAALAGFVLPADGGFRGGGRLPSEGEFPPEDQP